ncbi:MAG: class I SAM-dependent DNA methyltransferase [Candidatus Thorarchaeota archaeon]
MNAGNDKDYYINGQHYDNMIESRKAYESIPFYVKQAKIYGGPVLELACGTGRITIPIAQEKISIVGLEFSVKMLDQAKINSEKHSIKIKWIEGDMTNFNLGTKFPLIIMPAAALNWVLNNKNLESCLSCVKKHLRKNAKFIFNVFNPNLDILHRDPSFKYQVYEYPNPHGEGVVKVSENSIYDKATQINYLNTYHQIIDKEILKKLKLRMLFPQELDALLYYNDFIIDNKYGTFDEKPFNSDSKWQIVICHKK